MKSKKITTFFLNLKPFLYYMFIRRARECTKIHILRPPKMKKKIPQGAMFSLQTLPSPNAEVDWGHPSPIL